MGYLGDWHGIRFWLGKMKVAVGWYDGWPSDTAEGWIHYCPYDAGEGILPPHFMMGRFGIWWRRKHGRES